MWRDVAQSQKPIPALLAIAAREFAQIAPSPKNRAVASGVVESAGKRLTTQRFTGEQTTVEGSRTRSRASTKLINTSQTPPAKPVA